MVFRKMLDRLKSTGVLNSISLAEVGTIFFAVVISKMIVNIANPPPPQWYPMIEDEDEDEDTSL